MNWKQWTRQRRALPSAAVRTPAPPQYMHRHFRVDEADSREDTMTSRRVLCGPAAGDIPHYTHRDPSFTAISSRSSALKRRPLCRMMENLSALICCIPYVKLRRHPSSTKSKSLLYVAWSFSTLNKTTEKTNWKIFTHHIGPYGSITN